MYNSNPPEKSDLPSSAKLIKSTILAAFAAGLILIGVVMPAEYGIDPTGIGELVGLKKMGQIKTSLAKDSAQEAKIEQANTLSVASNKTSVMNGTEASQANSVTSASTLQTHERTVTLAPDDWTEIKLKMRKGDKANFNWFTDGGLANFDTHADSKTLNIEYHSYTKGSKLRDEGILEAAFDGNHGWFWRNRTDKTMTIILKTNGEYQDIMVLK